VYRAFLEFREFRVFLEQLAQQERLDHLAFLELVA
jgi:hypothetical protein